MFVPILADYCPDEPLRHVIGMSDLISLDRA